MLQAALRSGTAHRRSVFELFPRRLPEGRRYGVVAGVGRALDALERVPLRRRRRWRRSRTSSTGRRCEWLASYRFSGDVWGYAEGEAYFPYSPAAGRRVDASPRRCCSRPCCSRSTTTTRPIASAASRMTLAAGDRPVHRDGLAAHPRGGGGGGRAGGVRRRLRGQLQPRRPPAVRRADDRHQRAQLHAAARHRGARRSAPRSTRSARARRCWSTPTTSPRRCGSAVEVAGPGLGAVRLDSGDLGVLAHQVRAQLDSLGATGTRIIVTSDLDEFAIAALAAAPVDGYGVGTELVTGSGHPTCGFVYKLVAREAGDRRAGVGGQEERRTRSRSAAASTRCAAATPTGVAEAEVIGIGHRPVGRRRRPRAAGAAGARRRGRRPRVAGRTPGRGTSPSRAELPVAIQQMSRGEPVIPTVHE